MKVQIQPYLKDRRVLYDVLTHHDTYLTYQATFKHRAFAIEFTKLLSKKNETSLPVQNEFEVVFSPINFKDGKKEA